MQKTRCAVVCLVVVAGLVIGNALLSPQANAQEAHGIVKAADLKWTPIMKGCDMAAISGDPNADGSPFVVRLKCVAGTRIPAHWHPTDENVTVLSGTFQVGMGDKFEVSKMETMPAGSFATVAKEARHFAYSKTSSVLQVHGIGPFQVNWVNPEEVQPPDAKPAAAKKPSSK